MCVLYDLNHFISSPIKGLLPYNNLYNEIEQIFKWNWTDFDRIND
jgi:hypothetical protein